MKRFIPLSLIAVLLLALFSACGGMLPFEDPYYGYSETTETTETTQSAEYADVSAELPQYSGQPYVVLKNNVPDFTDEMLITTSYEYYSELDYLGRCGYAEACVGVDIMPTEDRGSISHVHPTGWQSVKYDFVEGESLYNRCHLIAFQLTGENANVGNLITGTRYMNTQGMLPFEEMVGDYVRETGNHVLYRVTPVFVDRELVARGVIMEGYSVEDGGEGICFNVYAFNVQPGVVIDYATGDNREDTEFESVSPEDADFVLNTGSKKFHLPSCGSVEDMSPHNREYYAGTRQSLIDRGYAPCGSCKP